MPLRSRLLCSSVRSQSLPQGPDAEPRGHAARQGRARVLQGGARGRRGRRFQVVTAESMKMTEGMPDFAGMLKSMTPVANPTIDKVTVTGNTAKVDASYKEGATSSTDHWNLVKIGADWKMDMTKK